MNQMNGQWVRRRAHPRRTRRGRTSFVSETWEFRAKGKQQSSGAYRHRCPDCGARVVSVRMKRGGWAHFEGAAGLGRVKHPCFHRGEKLSQRRDDETPDLFDEIPSGDP
jgi:hypothetical protein